MGQSAAGGYPGGWGRDQSSKLSHERHTMAMRRLNMLLLEDDPKEQERIVSSIRLTAAEVKCVPTVTAALFALDNNSFDAIMIDRHLGGWVSAQACKDLVVKAGDIPVVGLINEDCVLGLQDGIEAGLSGVYYKDQMGVHLMRRLGRLAYAPSLGPSLVKAQPPEPGRRSRGRARPRREL